MSRRRLNLVAVLVLAAAVALVIAKLALAVVTVTPATGGTGISADRAQNATSPLWTTLGNIVISENNNGDFASPQTNTTLILTAPSNWQFNSGVGSVSHQNGRNISASSIGVTNSKITVTISVSGTNRADTLTISGIQVQSTNGALLPNSGNILRTAADPGTATIAGITNDSTNFGSLSQVVGAPSKLGITAVNGGSNPTAGTGFPVVVQSQDQFSNAANVTLATGVSLSLNTGTGTLGGTTTGTIALGTSSVTISGVTYTKAESGVSLTATRTSGNVLSAGNSASFTVDPGALDHFAVEAQGGGAIGTQTEGVDFDIRVTAQDANNNTVTGYTSTVDITSTGNLTLGAGTTAAFSAGVLASHTVRISNTGSFTITATRTSGGSQNGTSNLFTVNPGVLDHFVVEAQSGGPIGTQTAGTSFDIRVTAQDANNNTVTGYTSTVDITSTGNLTLGAGTTAAFSAGVLASHTVRISNTGSFTITATRTSGGSESGTSNSFNVNAGAATKLAITAVPGTVAVGTGFSVTVQSQDANGNPSNVVAATGISLSGSGSGTLSGNMDTIAAGTNTKTLTGVSYDTAQTITLTAARVSGDSLSDSAASSSIVFTAPPSSTITFPAGGPYNAAGWAAGCASAGFCGTGTDNSGTGLATVQLSIRRGSGNYWDGDGFDSAAEVFVAASLAGSNWSYGFGSGSFPADDSYTVRSRATDNVGGVESSLPSQTFSYDATAPIGLTITSPSGTTNDSTPTFSGAAGTALGDSATVTVKVYDSTSSLVQTRTAPVVAASWLIDADPVLTDGSYTATATQTDVAGNSTTTGAIAFTMDATAPSPPSSLGTSPASPANDNNPKVTGTAEGGSTVEIFTSSDCSGAPVATGTGATFGGAGLAVPAVSDNSSTTYHATATDAANNVSLCSGGVTYVEDSDPPAVPTGLTTSPISPANDNDPEVSGTAEAGTTVRLFTSSDCSGAPAASGPAATFNSTGISINVADNSSSTFKAVARDAAGNESGCSSGTTYLEDSTSPSSLITFPTGSAGYNAAGWNAGCGPSGLCGTANDSGGSGLAEVEFSLKRDSNGLYWDGDGFNAAGEAWVTASGTATWTYGFAASSFPVDGDYTLRVRAVDNAANQEVPSSRTFTIDTTAPETQIDSSPPDPTNNQNASFSFSGGETGATFECRLDAGSWSPCTSPESYSSLGEGSHTFRVQATDAAGNVDATPALRSWTIDLTDPTVSPAFPNDGAWYNAAGWNAGCAPSGVCGTASDAGGAGLQSVEVSVRRVSDGMYWDGGGFSSASEDWHAAAGTGSWNLAFPASNFPADESYGVRARASDNAGNVSPTLARTFTIDSVPPETTIDSGPPDPSNSDSASFGFSADEPGSTFQCRLEGGTWAACTSPELYNGLAEGSHSFDVRATDPGGNLDPTPASSTWVVDTLPPAGSMDNPGPYLRGTVTLTASATDSGGTGVDSVTFQRSPAGAGTWTPLASDTDEPYSFDWNTTSAADGLYDLRVVIVDNATNETNSLSVPNIRVDNTPPDALMDDPGANVSGTVTLSHSSTDEGSGLEPASVQFEYRASPGGPWTATGSSWDTTALADGFYDLRVSVADRAGNTDASSEITTRVDNTPPDVELTSPTDGGYVNATSADPRTIVASATDLGSGVASVEFFACSDASLDCATGTWTSLGVDSDGEPYEGSWPLPTDGNRALKAAATDNAGQSAFNVIDVTVDRTVPETSITVQPADPSNIATPVFEFASTELGASFECQVDGGGWAACASPHTLTPLSDAMHTFEVRAVDLAGNIDASPASMTWLVDTTPPTASMNDPGTYLRGTVTLMSATEDPGANASGIASIDYQYSADGTNWASTAADWDTTLVSDGLYAVRVVVIDNAGNVTESAPIADRMVDNTPPATAIDDPGANIRQLITLTGSATDDGSGVLEVDFQYTATGGSSWTTISTDTAAPYDAPFDTVSVPDGLYDFRTVARDAAGNETEGTPIMSRRIDNTPPTATMNDPGSNLRGTVTLTSAADDPGGSGVSSVVYEVSPAGAGSWTPISGTWDTSSVGDGVYDLHVVVTDVAGNQTISAPVGDRRVDNTPPTTSDDAPSGWQRNPVTVTLAPSDGSGSGVSNTQFSVDGGSYSSGTSVSIPAPSDGSNDGIHTIGYFSTDVAGNIESPKTASVAIDATPPAPGADDPGTYLSGTVTLSANPSDSNGIVSVEFQRSDGGGGWATIGTDLEEPYSVQWNTTDVSDGPYDLRVIVTDEAENTAVEDLPGKIVDNTPPTAGVGSPAAGSVVSGNVTIGATALDANPITSVEYFVRGGSIGTSTSPPFTRSWDSTSGSDGDADIYVVVTDIAGHTTTSGSISITVDNFAPAVSLADPGANGRGMVPLSASADSDTVQVSFERRPAGGGGWTTIATDIAAPWGTDFDTTLVSDGMYELRAIAVDAGSNSGVSNVHTMRVDNTLPSGSLTAPGGGATVGGASVPVAANAGDSGSGVALVTWEFRPAGGGGYSSAASTTGSPYQGTWNASALASGDYELRVVVRDGAGNEFASGPVAVTVDNDPPTITLDNPGALLSGTVALTAQTSGGTTAVTFAYSPAGSGSWTTIGVDNAAPWSRSFNTTSLPDGLYDLRGTAVDAVGNSASSVVAGVRIDNNVPSLVSSAPANNSIVSAASSIQLTVSEEIDALLGVTLDGAATVPAILSGSQATFNTGALGPGAHTLTGTIRDKAGRTRAFSIFFAIGTPPPSPPPPEPAPTPGATPGAALGSNLGPLGILGCLSPFDFTGEVGIDSTLTIRWKPGRAGDKPCDTLLYVDGVATMSFPSSQTKANLGPISAADTRVFTLFAVGPDGTMSGASDSLRAVPAVFGHTLAEATALLEERGFAVGVVVGTGAVVDPSRLTVARKGSAIDLVLAEPKAKLIFQVVGTKRFSWERARHVAARIKTTKPVRVSVSLLSPRGERLYRWRLSTRAGASIAKLPMPRQVRRPAVYRLVFSASAGSETVRRTIRFRLIGPKLPRAVQPGSEPVDIVLAGGPATSEDIALGLDTPKTRVLEGNSDSTFDLAGDTGHNVQVIVVDVDRYGVRLVRDLHTVFPMVRLVALSNNSRRLALSMKAGATVALPLSTPAPKLAQVIRRLAYRA